MLKDQSVDYLEDHVCPGRQAKRTYDQHPYTGDYVDSAFGDGAYAAPLVPATAKRSVETEREASDAGEHEKYSQGERRGHLPVPEVVPRGHPGEQATELGVIAQGDELQGASEVFDVALAGFDGFFDVAQR